MNPWQRLGVAGGVVLGAAATATAVIGRTTGVRRSRSQRAGWPEFGAEELGGLRPDREYTVTAEDGVALSVEEVDPRDASGAVVEAELTVVLCHGFTLDRRSWHFQRKALAQLEWPHCRLVLYDHRSHGRSGRSTRRKSRIDQLARDLESVLRFAVPEGQMVLVGHSMGAMALMGLAEHRPEMFSRRVIGTALIATTAGKIGGQGFPRPMLSRRNPATRMVGQLASWQPGVVEGVRRLGQPVTHTLVRNLAFADHRVDPRLMRFMDQMMSQLTVRTIIGFLRTLGEHNRVAALPALSSCETLVIGAERDQLTPASHSEVIAAELPEARLVLVPDSGHMVLLERPDVVNEELVEFLRRVCKRLHNAAAPDA